MLPKENRIKKKKDFDNLFKNGYSHKNNILVLKAAASIQNISRFGIVVSQKISKKAVIRNKIRRRLSEIARLHLPMIKKGADIVLIALPGIEKKNFNETKEQAILLFKKAGII